MDLVVHDGASMVAEEDRISSLSDDIIHHILSFVDIKDAIQTRKVSRRGRHIWTTMPYLNIDTSKFRDLLQFAKFMKHALSHRNNSALVSSVNLTFKGSPTQLTLRQEHYIYKDLEYPQILFSCHTLKILTLTGMRSMSSDTSCFVPESGWDFPSLETLNLTNTCITGVTDKSVNPFTRCVNLKNLTLHRLRMHIKGIFIIDAPQLSNLTITNDSFSRGYTCGCSSTSESDVTASLMEIDYSCSTRSLQMLTEGFNSLEKVKLFVCSSSYGKTYVPLALLLDIFHKVSSATVLILDKNIIEVSQKRSREPVPDDGISNKVARLQAENKQAEITDEEKRTLKEKIPTQGEVIETQLGYLTDSKRVYSNNIQIQADFLDTDTAPSPSSVNFVNIKR